MSIAIKRLERAIRDLPKGGMQTGSHKVKLDLSDAERLIVELNALQAERDALASKLNVVASVFPLTCRTACEGILLYPMEQYNKVVSALNAEPQYHLSAHDAEVAKDAFIAGAEEAMEEYNAPMPFNANRRAEQYAAQLRAKAGE